MAFAVSILVTATLTPYFVLRNNIFGRRRQLFPPATLSLCNCFAAGVFLATCFLGLIPHTYLIEKEIHERIFTPHEHEHHEPTAYTSNTQYDHDDFLRSESHSHSHRHTWLETLFDANLMILIGFLFTLFVEQMVDFHQSLNIHKDAAHKVCKLSARSCHQQTTLHSHSHNNPEGANRKMHQTVPRSPESDDPPSPNGDVVEPLVLRCASSLDEESDENEILFSSDPDVNMRIFPNSDDAENGSNLRPTHPVSENCVSVKTKRQKNSQERRNSISKNRQSDGEGAKGSRMRSLLLLLAMSTHSFFEGIALGAQEKNYGQFLRLLISIMLHEVLCAFAYGLSLSRRRSRISTFWAIFSSLILASSIPLGMILMSALGALSDQTTSLVVRFVLEGLAAGIFIYVACMEMLAHEFSPHSHSHNEPSDEGHHHHGDPLKASVVVFGAMLAFAVNSLIGH